MIFIQLAEQAKTIMRVKNICAVQGGISSLKYHKGMEPSHQSHVGRCGVIASCPVSTSQDSDVEKEARRVAMGQVDNNSAVIIKNLVKVC